MKVTNVEIKATCNNPRHIRDLLAELRAIYIGRDHQVDTYYQTSNGRLKLRQGNIENALIAYTRENTDVPKQSDVLLYKTHDAEGLLEILNKTCEILAIVDKTRDIYFIDNIKFHIDEVKGLGTFVEIEAIDKDGSMNREQLHARVVHYMAVLGITKESLLAHSYSDMILSCV